MRAKAIFFAAALAVASSATAQQQQTFEDLQSQCLVETGQLRQALGQALAQVAHLRKELAEAKTKAGVAAEPVEPPQK